MSEAETVAYLEQLWATCCVAISLIANRSSWRQFPVVQNDRWYYRNIVLLGDALHTAHFSIGSGTKLAMEDAINLFNAFDGGGSVQVALEKFQGSRREDVEKTQYAANVSALWTENPSRYWRMEPIQACFSMLSRAKAVTYENLRMRDPAVRRERAVVGSPARCGNKASTCRSTNRRRRCSPRSASDRWSCRTASRSRR